MAAQTAHDLRTLLARRVGVGRRVAVLSSDEALVRAIQLNGCTVLEDPESLEALAAFHPDVVVAFDGFAARDGAAAFRALASAAGSAQLLFSFANAASASLLVSSLTGAAPTPALSEPDVRRWLSSAGYVISSRDVVVTPHRASGLAADTEAALRQLFEQLNPAAAADRLLFLATRGAAATTPDRTPGLVSVIVSSSDDEALLTGTLSSLVNQQRKPLELVVVANLPMERLDRVLERSRSRSGVTVVGLTSASADAAARTNAGLAVAQGQYLAFAEAGVLCAPTHLSTLVTRIEERALAWALTSSSLSGAPLEPRDAAFSLATWLEREWVSRAEWLLDTSRLGTFPLTFAEGVEAFETVTFARLALLFEPAWAGGPPTAERLTPSMGKVDALLAATKGRPLRGLTTLEALLRRPAPPSLEELVSERLERTSPRAARAFESATAWSERVRTAWRDARRSAEEQLRRREPPDTD